MSKAHISFDQDFRFMLMHHWTLHDSMYYSNYVASKLGLWKDRSNSNKLQHLLARMGFKLTEAKQNYTNMKGELKKRLPEALAQYAGEFGLTDVVYGTFKKQRAFGSTISAADCVHIVSAMLYNPAGGEERWADSFFKAYDALQVSIRSSLFRPTPPDLLGACTCLSAAGRLLLTLPPSVVSAGVCLPRRRMGSDASGEAHSRPSRS